MTAEVENHYVEYGFMVSLRLAGAPGGRPDRWILDDDLDDGLPSADQYMNGPVNCNCECDDPDGCDTARARSELIVSPSPRELYELIGEQIRRQSPNGDIAG